MDRKKDDILNSGILEQYVLGILDEEEASEVEAMLEEYPELWDYVKDLRVTLTAVSFQNGIRPPVYHREKSETAAIPGTSSDHSVEAHAPRRLHWFSWGLLAVLGVMNLYIAYNYQRLLDRFSELEHNYASAATRLGHARTEHAMVLLMMDPGTAKQTLEGEYHGKSSHSWIYLNREHGAAYWMPGQMPELGHGESFRIWAEVSGKMVPVSGSLHRLDQIAELEFVPEADRFHITIENGHHPSEPDTDRLVASGPTGISR